MNVVVSFWGAFLPPTATTRKFRQEDIMAAGESIATLELEMKHRGARGDWYSAPRQAKRNVVRMNWARHVLQEEATHPSTHSAARLRRARNIVASFGT